MRGSRDCQLSLAQDCVTPVTEAKIPGGLIGRFGAAGLRAGVWLARAQIFRFCADLPVLQHWIAFCSADAWICAFRTGVRAGDFTCGHGRVRVQEAEREFAP